MAGPLTGIKVLDLGAFGVGPAACSMLALMGAEAIRVEPPNLDGLIFVGTAIGGYGSTYIGSHFNKKSIILDLRDDKGKELGKKLIQWADIVVNNRRLGALERIGFGYETMSKINPRVIYIESTSYGNKGPWSKYAAGDHFVQAASGLASVNGKEGGEPEIFRNAAHADVNASSNIVVAALIGLLAREITGRGQKIETSHLQATMSMQVTRMSEFFATGKNPRRLGSANVHYAPSQSFKTWDNKYINISVPRESCWPKLCAALELQNVQNDARFKTNALRVKNRDELIPLIQEKIADKPAYWWMLHLRRNGVPCGLNYDYEALISDPHVQANGWLFDMDSMFGVLKGYVAPWEFDKSPAEKMTPAVKPDRNRDEILKMLKS